MAEFEDAYAADGDYLISRRGPADSKKAETVQKKPEGDQPAASPFAPQSTEEPQKAP